MWVVLALTGCVSEDQQLLNTWRGVYELQGHTETVETCEGDSADIPIEPAFFELDALAGPEAHLVELRACEDPEECSRTWFLNGITSVANNKAMTAGMGEWLFTLTGGTNGTACHANYVFMEFARSGAEADEIEVLVTSHSGLNSDVRTEEECIEFLDVVAADTEACDVQRTMIGRRVE